MPENSCSGIYEITNTTNGHRYIGSAKNIATRWYKHRRRLRKNEHHNAHLQNAWNKYGENSFRFDVLTYCPSPSLLYFEQIFLDEEQPEYNICRKAGNTSGRPCSNETRRKISKAHIGIVTFSGRKHTDEAIEKMRQAKLGNRYSEGREITDKTRRKMSESAKNRPPRSEETRAKISRIVRSREPWAKVSPYIVIDPLGNTHQNIYNFEKFCREYNLNKGAMWNVAHGNASNHKGWTCFLAEDITNE